MKKKVHMMNLYFLSVNYPLPIMCVSGNKLPTEAKGSRFSPKEEEKSDWVSMSIISG